MPDILDVIIPGVIFVEMLLYFVPIKPRNFVAKCLAYIIAGVIIRSIFSFAHTFVLPNYIFPFYARVIILCFAAAIFAVAAIALYKSRRVNSLVSRITYKDLRKDIFTGLIDFKQGMTMVITTNDGTVYIGSLFMIEERDEDSWLALVGYSITSPDGKTIDDTVFKRDNLLLIKKADIARACFLYRDGSLLAQEVRNVRKKR